MATGHVLKAEVRRYIVSNVVSFLQQDGRVNEFDAIAARGMSGLLIAAPVCTALDKDLIIVRKPGEGKGNVEYNHGGKVNDRIKWIALDDWISGGSTMNAILKIMKEAKYKDPVAILLYGNEGPSLVTKFNLNKAGEWPPPNEAKRSYILSTVPDGTPEWLSEYSSAKVSALSQGR